MKKPGWLKVKAGGGHTTRSILRHHGVTTVCEQARCPNQSECFEERTATFLLLGSVCTRSCSFCSVRAGSPLPQDHDEPGRVVAAAEQLGLEYVVLTSVTRDDLPDFGAGHFAMTVRALKRHNRKTRVEVLIPDFRGSIHSLQAVLRSGPNVFGHNIETVPRLYPSVRPLGSYRTSLRIIRAVRSISPGTPLKSGIMVGLGETGREVESVMRDLRDAGCDLLTIGQYLQPSADHHPVHEYIHPGFFENYRLLAMEMGFAVVESSPLTRSSTNAGFVYNTYQHGSET